MTSRTLIRGATVVSVDARIGTLPRGDILVEGGRIVAVAPAIEAADVEVVDGTGRIAIPGLVDAHRHLWMTLLRGYVSDGTWSSYLVETFWGRKPLFGAEEHRVAAFAGALEAVEAGTTTVLAFHDASTAPGLADAALDGLAASGARAVFAYGLEGAPELPEGRPASRAELGPTHGWHREEARALRAGRLASDDGLLTLGITTRDLERLPWASSEEDLSLARSLGVRTITLHAGSGALSGERSFVDGLAERGLLGPELLISHGQSFTDGELDTLATQGVKIVVSAESELGQGADPVTWRALQHGMTVAIGCDSVGSLTGDLFRQLPITLKAARGSRNRLLDAQGIAPVDVPVTAADMLEIATMGGARALRLDDSIGSLTPGKQADIVLLRTDRLGLRSGASPEQVVVLQASGRDVETVMVAGRVLKRDGRLVGIDQEAIARDLARGLERVETAFARLDLAPLRRAYDGMFAG